MCSAEMLFCNFVQCMGAARSSRLLPLSTAGFRRRLPRAPCLGRLGLELLMEEANCQVTCMGSLLHFAQTSLKNGNEELSVPYSTSPSDAAAALRGKWVIGSPWESAGWKREMGFACHHPGEEGNPGQKSRPFLDPLSSLPLGQSQRGGCGGESLSMSVQAVKGTRPPWQWTWVTRWTPVCCRWCLT